MSNHEHDHTEDMIELELNENNIEVSKQECQHVIQKWINDTASIVVLIRGIGSSIGEFAKEVKKIANAIPLCQAIWVKDTSIFLPGQEEFYFQGKTNPPCCAVVFGFLGNPTALMDVTWNAYRIGSTIRGVF